MHVLMTHPNSLQNPCFCLSPLRLPSRGLGRVRGILVAACFPLSPFMWVASAGSMDLLSSLVFPLSHFMRVVSAGSVESLLLFVSPLSPLTWSPGSWNPCLRLSSFCLPSCAWSRPGPWTSCLRLSPLCLASCRQVRLHLRALGLSGEAGGLGWKEGLGRGLRNWKQIQMTEPQQQGSN